MGGSDVTTHTERSKLVETSDTIEAIEECHRLGWTDGLPVIPPADYKVREMLDHVGLKGDESLLEMSVRRRVLTAENAAACAVMAGCLPEYFPILVTVLKALDEENNMVHNMCASTGSPVPIMVINGPVRGRVGINCREGLLGPGSRANASIARTLQLIFINGFDARPGLMDRATMGDPGRFSMVFGEDEERSPWDPLHVERGFGSEDSTVTVCTGRGPVNVTAENARTVEAVLLPLADTMTCAAWVESWPCRWMVIIGQDHASMLKDEGWSKADIKAFLAENARRSVKDLKRIGAMEGDVGPGDDSTMVDATRGVEEILVVAAGGSGGPISTVVNLSMLSPRTRAIEFPAA